MFSSLKRSASLLLVELENKSLFGFVWFLFLKTVCCFQIQGEQGK